MAYIDNKAVWRTRERVRGLARAHVWAHTSHCHIHTASHTQIIVKFKMTQTSLRLFIKLRFMMIFASVGRSEQRELRSSESRLNICKNYLNLEQRRGVKRKEEKKKKRRSLRCLARALDFLSQDINEEMTHTCKESKKERRRAKEEERKREWGMEVSGGWGPVINSALSRLRREFHQKDGEKGILIAAPSTFPKTLTYLHPPQPPPPPSLLFPPPSWWGGSPWNPTGLPPHTHTHGRRITFRCGLGAKGRCVCVCLKCHLTLYGLCV